MKKIWTPILPKDNEAEFRYLGLSTHWDTLLGHVDGWRLARFTWNHGSWRKSGEWRLYSPGRYQVGVLQYYGKPRYKPPTTWANKLIRDINDHVDRKEGT